MRFACLGSGSKGNATIIQSGQTTIMVDCGFSAREAENRLRQMELQPTDIDALLVTHEHGDHIRGISVLSRRFAIPVWASRGTSEYFSDPDIDLNVINVHREFQIADVKITPIAVPHDAREPCQFIFQTDAYNFGLLTDLGCITSHIVNNYGACDAMLLEYNHDREMLMSGSYPMSLKRRVAGQLGHLSNDQANELLQQLLPGTLKFILAGHLSEVNNSPEIVRQEIDRIMHEHDCHFEIASQHSASHWYQLDQIC